MRDPEELHRPASASAPGGVGEGDERRASSVAEAWHQATVGLDRNPDREAALAALLEALRALVPVDRSQVMLVEEGWRLTVRAVFDGERVALLRAGERPEIDAADHPALHDVLAARRAVAVPDICAHAGWNLATEPAAEGSWLGLPLLARDKVAGLLSLSRSQPDPFDEDEIQAAESLTSHASVAVDNVVLCEQMRAVRARLQTGARSLVEAQERERRHIARELHDEAGQALASLRFGLRRLEREIGESRAVTTQVAELIRTTDAVIDGLHRLAADLRPASLDHLGLEGALRQYSRSAAATYGLDVRFKARGFGDQRLPSRVEMALFRAVQEAVTNVVRHARASRVDVLLEHRGDRVLAVVEDDGVGFEPERPLGGEHFGLLGLRERAEALDGALTVESAPGAGTTVVMEVACADPHPDR
jgi:signal transduction histidine kinase